MGVYVLRDLTVQSITSARATGKKDEGEPQSLDRACLEMEDLLTNPNRYQRCVLYDSFDLTCVTRSLISLTTRARASVIIFSCPNL